MIATDLLFFSIIFEVGNIMGGGGGGDCDDVNIHFYRDIMVFPPSKYLVAPSFHLGRDELSDGNTIMFSKVNIKSLLKVLKINIKIINEHHRLTLLFINNNSLQVSNLNLQMNFVWYKLQTKKG